MTITVAEQTQDLPEPPPSASPLARPTWAFVVQWSIISLFAPVGMVLVTALFSRPDSSDINRGASNLLVAMAIGLVLGGLQWAILRNYLPGAGWWVIATLGGCGLAGMLYTLALQFPLPGQAVGRLSNVLPDWGPGLFVSLVYLVAVLALPGSLQALVLKRAALAQPLAWLVVWVVGGLIAIGLLTLLIWTNQGRPLPFEWIAFGTLGIGLVWGVFTGIPLHLLLRSGTTATLSHPRLLLTPKRAAVLAGLLALIVLMDISLAIVLFRPVLIFYENFERDVPADDYTICRVSSIEQGRLRIVVPDPFTGCDVPFSSYQRNFTFEATAYFVDVPYDSSINLSFRHNLAGWYEMQLRPGIEQLYVMKVIRDGDHVFQHEITPGWIFTPDLEYRAAGNLLKLTADDNRFTLWFNDLEVYRFEDSDLTAFTSGQIRLGAGAAEIANVGYEFDDLRIWVP